MQMKISASPRLRVRNEQTDLLTPNGVRGAVGPDRRAGREKDLVSRVSGEQIRLLTPLCVLFVSLCVLCVGTSCATPPQTGSPRSDGDGLIARRVVEWEGVSNARDLGGLPGLDGRMVRKGRIYRSAGLNKNANYKGKDGKRLPRSEWKGPGETLVTPEAARHIVETLGVKIDLDLRNDAETFGMEASPLGADVRWILLPSSDYGKLAGERGRKAFAKGFRIFLDEGNYPILFHCKGGADRTGTLACILNGLLGVEEDLLYLDWRFTWTDSFKKPVPEEAWGRLMAVFAEYEGETLNERIEQFVLSCGIAPGEIETFRNMMLEDAP